MRERRSGCAKECRYRGEISPNSRQFRPFSDVLPRTGTLARVAIPDVYDHDLFRDMDISRPSVLLRGGTDVSSSVHLKAIMSGVLVEGMADKITSNDLHEFIYCRPWSEGRLLAG